MVTIEEKGIEQEELLKPFFPNEFARIYSLMGMGGTNLFRWINIGSTFGKTNSIL